MTQLYLTALGLSSLVLIPLLAECWRQYRRKARLRRYFALKNKIARNK
jgi:hypothetical protein